MTLKEHSKSPRIRNSTFCDQPNSVSSMHYSILKKIGQKPVNHSLQFLIFPFLIRGVSGMYYSILKKVGQKSVNHSLQFLICPFLICRISSNVL